MGKLEFKPGDNIAMKVPPARYEATVEFYRDALGFEVIFSEDYGVAFEFGGKTLWIDKVETLSQAEVWLEIETNDTEAAAAHFKKLGIERCDEVENLPEGFKGFWIASPSSIIHLLAGND